MRSSERARPSESGYRHRVEGGDLRVATWNIRAAIGPGEPFPPDHVFVRDLRVIDCAVDESAGDASDHLPVVATLAVA